jgi:hypothetical protein
MRSLRLLEGLVRRRNIPGACRGWWSHLIRRERRGPFWPVSWIRRPHLEGVPPAETPIERPTRFETVVNLKTARFLGLKIPEAILLRTDELLE